jgi:hypothetical protein
MALVAGISTTLVYLPSAVSQLLQFRTGVLGSLKDPYFQAYRIAPDRTTYLFGSAFWGLFFLVNHASRRQRMTSTVDFFLWHVPYWVSFCFPLLLLGGSELGLCRCDCILVGLQCKLFNFRCEWDAYLQLPFSLFLSGDHSCFVI